MSMTPEDQDEPETQNESGEETSSEEVYAAEVIDGPSEDSSVEVVDAAVVPAGTSIADVFDSARNESSQGQPGEKIWPNQYEAKPRKPLPPREPACKKALIAFSVATAVTLLFLIFFLVSEFRLDQDGRIIIRRAILVAFVFFGNAAAIFRVQRDYVPNDVRYGAWASLIMIAICGLFLFPSRWLWICFGWALFQLPTLVAIGFAPSKVDGEEMTFNVNDSVAANGGSVAAVVLGFWSILGSLFSTLSIINSVLGVLLGLWGLNSRKKGMAVFGIILCLLGVMASMMNVTYFFWEMIQVPDEQLLEAVQ